ncbi:hypothetical protein B0H34DRAFT_714779 [Crassisporium funariophilum]|nr:hypothetical protein B0H34DRAFT_714779 [Crassisporium funariophilum]
MLFNIASMLTVTSILATAVQAVPVYPDTSSTLEACVPGALCVPGGRWQCDRNKVCVKGKCQEDEGYGSGRKPKGKASHRRSVVNDVPVLSRDLPILEACRPNQPCPQGVWQCSCGEVCVKGRCKEDEGYASGRKGRQ